MNAYTFSPRTVKRELNTGTPFEFSFPAILFDDIGVDETDAYFAFSLEGTNLKFIAFNFAAKRWRLLYEGEMMPERYQGAIRFRNDIILYAFTRHSTVLYIKRPGDTLIKEQCVGIVPPAYISTIIPDEEKNTLYQISLVHSDVYRLNLNTMEWDVIFRNDASHIPVKKWFGKVLHKSKLYLFGGTDADNRPILNSNVELCIFDTNTNRWCRKPINGFQCTPYSNPIYPGPRKGCVSALVPGSDWHDPFAVLYGGAINRKDSTDLWHFNLKLEKWFKWESTFPQGVDVLGGGMTPQGKIIIIDMASDCRGINEIMSIWPCIPKLKEMAWEALLFYKPDWVKKDFDVLRELGIPDMFINRIIVKCANPAILFNS